MFSRDSRSTALEAAAVSQVPAPVPNDSDGSNANANVGARQITLTQTLTNGGSITTAIVTLDRGVPPTEAPPPPDRESYNSSMPPQTIGIIVGCSVGIVVLILIVAFCCIAARRRAMDGRSDDGDESDMSEMSHTYQETGRMRSWVFPWSIPPPTMRPGQMPHYRTRAPPRRYTAHDPAENRYI